MSSGKRHRSSSPGTSKRHLASEEKTQDDRSGYDFEVFLSFCGDDTRTTLTDFLYQRLTGVGIRTFRDNDELQKGENIQKILPRIQKSKISIPIFSTNYASREWCMCELAKMVECRKTKRQTILPIFYDVSPSVVRKQSDSFKQALLNHEKKFGKRTVQKWKEALQEVGSISGWVPDRCFDGHQGKLVDDVVSAVRKELKKNKLHVRDHNIVGLADMKERVMELLDIGADDVRMVGIYGQPMVGKTILSKLIYNEISDGFECCSFIANIREKSEKKGLEHLQKQLIVDVLGGNCSDRIHNVDDGISIISQRFCRRNVLILLDDVDQREHLDAFAEENKWFGPGSRIIVTTRSREITEAPQIYDSFEVTNPEQFEVYNSKQSLKLLLRKKVEDEEFYKRTNDILASLREDEVSRICIHGLGGVGKTTLAMNVHDHIKCNSSSDKVYWAVVSESCSIHMLQSKIAKAVDVDLSKDDDEHSRAAELSIRLSQIRNFVLFLDDVCSYFPLELLGVSDEMKECKFILTSRSSEVCRRMGCNKIFRINPLRKFAAWNLFMKTIGHEPELSGDIGDIAQSITEECRGLPLGIITMASSMRGVNDIHEWSDSLQRLKEAKEGPENMDSEVFSVLKFSYDRLRDRQLQQCFLYCAVYPEDWLIRREVLIELLIDVGLIEEADREKQIDRGHTILNKLENSCLLESAGDGVVKMHDLIRDMALRISKSTFMVKSGQFLHEPPDAEDWASDVEVVSLMRNNIKEITFSPRCPALSILLLNSNYTLSGIRNCFFEKLSALRVLDLSNTDIVELPNSVADLVNLTALRVSECRYLKRIPSLAKLSSLRKLDLSYTAIEEVPDGMENMADLRNLDLCCEYLKKIPSGILPKLSSICHLRILWPEGDVEVLKNGELGSLKKLETLKIHFRGISEYMAFTRSRVKPNRYYVLYSETFGLPTIQPVEVPKDIYKFVEVQLPFSSLQDSLNSDAFPLPEDVQGIISRGGCFMGSLWELLSRNNVFNLKYCEASGNMGIDSITSSLVPASQIPVPPGKIFSHLRCLHIIDSGIKRLFEAVLLIEFQNLEVLDVRCCRLLEEIIAEKEVTGQRPASKEEQAITLPKLRCLNLYSLWGLERISKIMLACNSLQEIEIRSCPKLRKIPLSLKSVNGQLSPPSSLLHIMVSAYDFDKAKRWWESLEWDVPVFKKILEPFVVLQDFHGTTLKLQESGDDGFGQ